MGDLAAAKAQWSQRLLLSPKRQSIRGHAPAAAAARALTSAPSPNPENNVVGVGIGWKITEGKDTGVMAVKFFVRMKYSESEISSDHLLPKSIDGLPVDVEESGMFRRFAAHPKPAPLPNPRTKIRPAQPGCSVGFRDPADQFVMAGTFGALVKDNTGTYVLSNNHVLADEGQLKKDSPIFQPGLLDGGNPSTDQIAKLTRFVPLQSGANLVDGAIAQLVEPGIVTRNILFIGPPSGTAAAQIDMNVHKFGRTTSYTTGTVTSIDTDVTVQYETGQFTFTGQIIVVGPKGHSFSAAGDSGSLILERPSNKAVGLLFAGSSSHTIANHIDEVLKELKVTLA
jgi:hypothetical protein